MVAKEYENRFKSHIEEQLHGLLALAPVEKPKAGVYIWRITAPAPRRGRTSTCAILGGK
jgi:hypothetical protein